MRAASNEREGHWPWNKKLPMKTSRFAESLHRANSLPPHTVARLLREHGVHHVRDVTLRPSVAYDRLGIDYIAHRYDGRRPLFIDLKETSYSTRKAPCVLLETASHGRAQKPGWATDSSKKTDLFLFTYGDGSALVLSARQVRAVMEKYGYEWMEHYRTGRSATQGFYETYYTEYVLVPQDVLTSACAEISADWRKVAQRPPSHVEEDPREQCIKRIEMLRETLERADRWQYERMTVAQLRQQEEDLVDEILSCGWQQFPRPPFAGLPGLIEPLTDYLSLKRDEQQMDNCVSAYVSDILSGQTYVYSVRLPERATVVVSRSTQDGSWRIASLFAAGEIRRETRGLVEGWLAARDGFAKAA